MHDMNRPTSLTRRRMALALPLLGSAAWLPSAFASAPAPLQRESRALMGTRLDIVAEGGNDKQLRTAIDHAWHEMDRLAALTLLAGS